MGISMETHDKLLCKIAEEAGEVIQAAMKAKLHGLDNNSYKDGESFRDRLISEMGDLVAAWELYEDIVLKEFLSTATVHDKKDKIRKNLEI
jgi:phosphoribosyl-ATP pyrophosphohydrolase